jgi:hypothetical protein
LLPESSSGTDLRSNLLQTILHTTKLRWEESLSLPPTEIFATIGNLTFLQLSTLRHRGAFSTVSLTFTKCCVLTQSAPQTSTTALNLLDVWYQVRERLVRLIYVFLTALGCAALYTRTIFNYSKICRHTGIDYRYHVDSRKGPFLRPSHGRTHDFGGRTS